MKSERQKLLRVGLIGLGKMGLSHLAIFRAHPSVDVRAICDRADYLLAPLALYTKLKGYTDYAELLDREELDAVVVGTPSRFHIEVVRKALERNLHVFCEKPFCLDPAEGRKLAEMAQSKGLVGQVGYHFRFVGAFQEAKRLIDRGVIGKVHNIRAEAYGPVVLRPKGSTWRSQKSEGGGCLYDYASHALDLMNYLVGKPRDVAGTKLNRIFSHDVEDEVYATLLYENGMTGHLMANWSDESFRKMSMKISVWGSEGKIQADRQEVQIFTRNGEIAVKNNLNPGWNIRYAPELTDEVWYYLRGEEYSAQVDAFVAAINGDVARNISPFQSALETDELIMRLLADAETVRSQSNSAPPTGTSERGFFSSIFRTRGQAQPTDRRIV